jgi:hypothetical protein
MLAVFTQMVVMTTPSLPAVIVEAGTSTNLGRALCSVRGDDRIKLVDGHLTIPAVAAGAHVSVAIGDCEKPETLSVYAVAGALGGKTEAWFGLDDARLQLRGGPLASAVIWLRIGAGPWRAEICPENTDDDVEDSECAVPGTGDDVQAVLAGAGLEVLRLPPGSPTTAGATPPELWSKEAGEAKVRQAPLDALRVPLRRLVINSPLLHAAWVDAWREQSSLALAVPGVVASVSCRPAGCWLSEDGKSLVVTPPSAGDALTITVRLRDRIWMRQGEGFVNNVTLPLPVARCQVRSPIHTVLGGTQDHRLPLVFGDGCPADLSGLTVDTVPPSGAFVERAVDRHMDVRLGRVSPRIDALELRVLRASTRGLVGTVRFDVRSGFGPIQVNLIDPKLREIPVIPTNREVRLLWAAADPSLAKAIMPVPVPGYYSLRRDGANTWIRGETRMPGVVPLRFAYVMEESGSSEPLVLFETDAHFPVRPVNVPVSLAPDDPHTGRLFSVYCRTPGDSDERAIAPGDLVSLPYGARGSCRLRVDRGLLTDRNGVQRIRVTVSVTSPTGTARSGGFSQVLVLAADNDVDSVWLGANADTRPFDHVSVQIAHDNQPGHYITEGEASDLPARRYQMIFGDARMRLYGSAAVPTGLYRIARGESGGILQFSAGALVRLAFLNTEGREYPFDFEFALLGTNLSGKADLSMVAGIGLTVPLLNPQESAQAAIGIHAWAEYAPTRSGSKGRPFGVIFGPSISFGDFGTNL